MQKIEYLKIQNFKIFGDEITINFDNPTVLIGANNAGKTTIVQAVALWSWALKVWFEKKRNTKSKPERNKGVALNRLEIAQVPIKEARYFWHNTKVRQNSNDNIGLVITLGMIYEGTVKEVGMIFKYHSPDLLYCQPTEQSFETEGLIEWSSKITVNLLYPMSGIGEKEFVFQQDAIRTQIGTGQTANVIRNICYHLATNQPKDWIELKKVFEDTFSVGIQNPFLRATGVIELLYNYTNRQQKTDYDLDITLAGRGQQQMLLVLAYLMSNRGAVLLIDEPDAHLEILRQAQIFTILKETAQKYDCQLVIVTHSEVVLNEANNVVFVTNGDVREISDKKEHKYIKDALKNYGIEHYYKAKLMPRILYVESSTDKAMLKAFADKFEHPLGRILGDKLNCYYTQNELKDNDLSNELLRKSGYFKPYKAHFQAIKSVVSEFRACAIFDGDNRGRADEIDKDLACMYWKWYEFENYFINPKTLMMFAEYYYLQQYDGKQGLFEQYINEKLKKLAKTVEKELILPVLNQDLKALEEFLQLPPNLQNVQFQNLASTKKLSELLEKTLISFAQENNEKPLLTKGNFYKLIDFIDSLPIEVKEKMDIAYQYLSLNP